MQSPQPSRIEIEDRTDHVRFLLRGAFAAQPMAAQFSEALQECRRLGRQAALIDVRELEGELDTLGRYSLGAQVGEFWDRTVRLAVIVRADQMDAQRIAELVATNRGVPAKVFTQTQEATDWLLPNPDKAPHSS